MSPFSPKNIAKAIEQVPGHSTKTLRNLLERANAKKIEQLVFVIEAELELRGAVELDEDAAQQHLIWAARAADLDLVETIRLAFRSVPMNDEERLLADLIASNPGIGYENLKEARGKGDVGLILGHMVYERLGFFRQFIEGKKRISDLLFLRSSVDGRVAYRLTNEAAEAFQMDASGTTNFLES